MNGHTENKKNTYAHLDRLSTEALEELLCADIKSPDDDDDEVVLHILEVIEQREKAIPTGRLSDVDKALEEFQTYYNIPEMNGVTLYPEETAESVTDAVTMRAASAFPRVQFVRPESTQGDFQSPFGS